MYLIEALIKPITVEDLGVLVKPNEPVVLTEEQYARSLCISKLIRSGAIRVSKYKPSRVELPPPPPSRTRVGLSASRTIVRETKPPELPKPPEDSSLKASEIEKLIERALEKKMRELLPSPAAPDIAGQILPHLSPLFEEITKNIQSLASSGVSSRSEGIRNGGRTSTGVEEPLFIPKGLVPETHTEITVQSESQSDGGLGDSAAALKKLRRRDK